LLFDRIQRDRHIPDAIKEQLARLQFPLLKVALAIRSCSPILANRRGACWTGLASTSIGLVG